MNTTTTPAQADRQKARKSGGRYAKLNPCNVCGKSAGADFCSYERATYVVPCICDRCTVKADKLTDDAACVTFLKTRPA